MAKGCPKPSSTSCELLKLPDVESTPFLKLVLNWFHGIPKKLGLKSYFMVRCTEDENGRNARLCKLDQLLQDHEGLAQFS
jgi:hypothetical protein